MITFSIIAIIIAGYIWVMRLIRKENRQTSQKNQTTKEFDQDSFDLDTATKIIETLRADKIADPSGPSAWQKMSKEQRGKNIKMVQEWMLDLALSPEEMGSTREELIELGIIIEDIK